MCPNEQNSDSGLIPEYLAVDHILLALTLTRQNQSGPGISLDDLDRYTRFRSRRQKELGYLDRADEEAISDPSAFKAAYRQIAWEIVEMVGREHPEFGEQLLAAFRAPQQAISDWREKIAIAWAVRERISKSNGKAHRE